ncbi:MAG: protein-L-isoaspartate(D-aspartate) O-methyltransferase [Opitutaceae bacterium]|nr:protein-L-isoaspartate(D-aspartate) O-methyltransferase [Opitutaceae bacterium]
MTTDNEYMMTEIERDIYRTRDSIGRDKLSLRVMTALRTVPRDKFVPAELKPFAYQNRALKIGHQQTISQPYIVALMTDLLELKPDAKVLEIGTGSGYQAAMLSLLANRVYSVEIIEDLAVAAKQRFKNMNYSNIETRIGNGCEGWPEHAPYDAIIVTAAATNIPSALTQQLKREGKMVIPIGLPHMSQELLLIEKDLEGNITSKNILEVAFVPLVAAAKDISTEF